MQVDWMVLFCGQAQWWGHAGGLDVLTVGECRWSRWLDGGGMQMDWMAQWRGHAAGQDGPMVEASPMLSAGPMVGSCRWTGWPMVEACPMVGECS